MSKNQNNGNRDNFASQLGIIMAAVGSAVGLGNIWRFSYMVGVNGGGAFLVVYLLCVMLVGMPVLIAELTIGRKSGLSTISAFKKLAPKTHWWITGLFSILAPTIIMCYYPVVAGWSLGYVFESLFNWSNMTADTGAAFGAFISSGKAFVFAGIALVVTAVILLGGIAQGIEKSNKILMPTLGLILIILVIRSLTLPGSMEGVKFLFMPDFSKLTFVGILDALGHSFFSLSLGMGIMITYASYMKKDADLPGATGSILLMDTGIALLAGLAIFPAVFALGIDPGQGAGLAFVTLPGAFAQMPVGWLFSALFFLLLFIAALTSMMSLMQVPLAYMEDELKVPKKKGIVIITIVLLLGNIPAVLSFSSMENFLIMGYNYFDFMDKLANNILLPITGLLGTLFIIFSLGIASSKEEFLTGANNSNTFLSKVYPVAVKFIAPIAIVLILLNSTGVFARFFGA